MDDGNGRHRGPDDQIGPSRYVLCDDGGDDGLVQLGWDKTTNYDKTNKERKGNNNNNKKDTRKTKQKKTRVDYLTGNGRQRLTK